MFGKFERKGKQYQTIAIAVNKSDIANKHMVVYHPADNGNDIYVRDYKEFFDKFKPIED